MQSGQGGIRWNSVTQWIQLQDENKNWVDWRYYNPNYQFGLCVHDKNGSISYTFPQYGLYLLVGGGDSAAITMNTSAAVSAIAQNASAGSRKYSVISLLANVNDQITISHTVASRCNYALYYIGNRFSKVTLVASQLNGNNQSSATLSFTNVRNRILVASAGGTAGTAVTTNTTTTNVVTDGVFYSCAAMIEETGSASMTAVGSTATSGGGWQAVFDLQLSN